MFSERIIFPEFILVPSGAAFLFGGDRVVMAPGVELGGAGEGAFVGGAVRATGGPPLDLAGVGLLPEPGEVACCRVAAAAAVA